MQNYYEHGRNKSTVLYYCVTIKDQVSYVKLAHPLSSMRRMQADKIRELRARGGKVRKLTAHEYYSTNHDEYLNHDWRGVMKIWRT